MFEGISRLVIAYKLPFEKRKDHMVMNANQAPPMIKEKDESSQSSIYQKASQKASKASDLKASTGKGAPKKGIQQ